MLLVLSSIQGLFELNHQHTLSRLTRVRPGEL